MLWMGQNGSSGSNSSVDYLEVPLEAAAAVEQQQRQPNLFVGYPHWLFYFAASCCTLFMLVGIPGNLITLAALFRTKKLRNATAVFIMNLSTSDLMFCCFNLPLATSTFWHGAWHHGPLLCRLFPLLRYGLVAVSLFTILAITINRYVMIGHPRLYPKLYKPRYLGLMVLATWAGGFGALIPTWFEQWGKFGLDPSIGSCSILPDSSGRSPKEFLFILAFLAPCLAIVVCYARIFYIVRKTALKSHRSDEATQKLVHSHFKKCSKNNEDSAIGSMSIPATQPSNNNEPSDQEQQRRVIPELRVQDNRSGDFGQTDFTRSNESLPYIDIKSDSTPQFLSPPATLSRYNNDEISDDGASSRSHSPTDRRRASCGSRLSCGISPMGSSSSSSRVSRQESRFRSVRGRNSETIKMTPKDRKLLKMILVIFSSFLVCYLPITITKTFKDLVDSRALNIAGYLLIYLTTCINPVIYVVMSSEYRSAYKNVLLCRSDSSSGAAAAAANLPRPGV